MIIYVSSKQQLRQTINERHAPPPMANTSQPNQPRGTAARPDRAPHHQFYIKIECSRASPYPRANANPHP